MKNEPTAAATAARSATGRADTHREAFDDLQAQLETLEVAREATTDPRELALICREITNTHRVLHEIRKDLADDVDEQIDNLPPDELIKRIDETQARLQAMKAKLQPRLNGRS